MDRVFDSFERTLIFAKVHDLWFDWRGEKLQKALDLYNDGAMKVMKQRDSDGRRVIIANNKVDMEKYDSDDVFRLYFLVFVIISMEVETQLCGSTYLMFCLNISMKYVTMYPLTSIYDFAAELKSAPLRINKITIVGLPTYAANLMNMVKLGLSDKMRDRLQMADNGPELWDSFDKKLFTADFGGDSDEQEAIDDFRKVIDEKIDDLRDFFESYEIDMTKAEALKDTHGNVGSFRKLEID